MKDLIRLPIIESSQVGEARRLAAALGRGIGFEEVLIGKVSLVVTELATNLIKHAGGGELILHSIGWEEGKGLEILSLDRGPGIRNPGESLRDGYSTTGSMGTGLGAVDRLSSFFDFYTLPGQGTVLFSRIWAAPPPETLPQRPLIIGAVCLPVKNEEVCGDSWGAFQTTDRVLVIVADGLGHGPEAAEASTLAVKVFEKNTNRSPGEIIEYLHEALKGTRGAAVATAEVLPGQHSICYAGVGNISGSIISSGTSRSLISHNGTAGLSLPRVQEFTYPWPEDGLLILHSDGLATHWALEDYPGLQTKHPCLIAGVLLRDHCRERDDVTVVVLKTNSEF
ncbi:MAG: ATP-binding SpoIIE family protein phosphatase [Thermodesulfobacteriota bacterium]